MELANLINQRKDIFFIDGMAWAQLIPTRYYNSKYIDAEETDLKSMKQPLRW